MALLKKFTAASSPSIQPTKRRAIPNITLLPLVTEKSSRLQALGQYTFAVRPGVSKVEVKKAIETIYGVRVIGVNSLRLPRKTVRRGRISGRTGLRRHMIVRLSRGQTLNQTKIG
ncbi:MAG: 50S ribosomal protein L23 [Candidatus Kerfeldbacteria bacterium]|nr:50S ribosomal protein L23 [Candidatus Kerfeldbacteria bacterium]